MIVVICYSLLLWLEDGFWQDNDRVGPMSDAKIYK